MRSLIVIPARYGSTRLPGKPLLKVGGVSLLARTVQLAQRAALISGSEYVVATDSEEIVAHARELGAPVVLTDPKTMSGSDRCLEAVEKLSLNPDIVINLQGDAPFTPPPYVASLAVAGAHSAADMFTIGVQLDWTHLDEMRHQKRLEPTSGTTCIRSEEGRAIWFSKSIIPTIRNEKAVRKSSAFSPVIRHVGLYGYKLNSLRRYVVMPPSRYELIEGLEQLRAIENGMHVHVSLVSKPKISMSGIDTQEDISLAERLISDHGDPYHTNVYV